MQGVFKAAWRLSNIGRLPVIWRLSSIVAGLASVGCGLAVGIHATMAIAASERAPVRAIADTTIDVGGRGRLPVYLSRDWSTPLDDVTRVVVVVHGLQRNAEGYLRHIQEAQTAAGEAGDQTMVIAPQFLAQVDADAFKIPADLFRWTYSEWEGGFDAIAPAPVSSFDALDALLLKLADRRIFTHLKEVVLAGHSGGAQLVQRFAIVSHGRAVLGRMGISVRYVVANPSSYVYFTAQRPVLTSAATCPRYDDWKYGMNKRIGYAAGWPPRVLEHGYLDRRVIYLIGSRDTDSNHPQLDKSCMGEAQGPDRASRGHFYVAMLKRRNGGAPNHVLWDVPGVGHSAGKMFNSPCGRAALFDAAGCDAPGAPR